MTSSFDTLVGKSYTAVSKDGNDNICHRLKNVLRAKENTYTNKCKKNLKRKLKKYKLRPDGREDQDIIDVSDTLVSSLFIRSPNKDKDIVELEIEKLRPKNYLFRMVRRKQTTLTNIKPSKGSEKTTRHEENKFVHVSPTTEEKKQTNAFKLLMESRNKSIGTNSPGKEKSNNEEEPQEFVEKKAIKAKRNLMLQKMAEEKGSVKKREIEEQHNKYIQKKMKNRAEKFKKILHKEHKQVIEEKSKERNLFDSIDSEKNEKVLHKSTNKLQLVNIFNEIVDKKISPEKKTISKEDEEFLKKLSPSIRKKESMLSYFKKIEKDPDAECEADAENDNMIIKVKFNLKHKKKDHKKILSLKRDHRYVVEKTENDDVVKEVVIDNLVELKEVLQSSRKNDTLLESSKERRKRKREDKETRPCNDSPIVNDCNTNGRRSKRTVKKPVKFDDAALTSSDEELHIFTPKKKKHLGSKEMIVSKTSEDIIVIIDDKDTVKTINKESIADIEKNIYKEKKPAKDSNSIKPVKLAPIFSKPRPDAAAIEAKQKFLQSGVPEQLKKLMSIQKSCNTLANSFATVVHVQQLDRNITYSLDLNLPQEIDLEKLPFNNSIDAFAKMLDLSTSQGAVNLHAKKNVNTHTQLQNLKDIYPRFPVYRTYKLLKGKKKGEFKDSDIYSNLDNSVEILNCSIDMQNDNPDQLTWSDKYKALNSNEIIGNFDSIKELKKWLVTWTENDSKCNQNNGNDSDSSDYYQSELDSRDSMKSNNNLLVLSGPVGCGKTSSVYAVAAELCMKVIEVNASSKRTGKIMLQDLQEATQSHKVNRGVGSSENSQKTPELIEPLPTEKIKKRGRPKKMDLAIPKKLVKEKPEISNGLSASQEITRTAMSLILIDDADIIFDQDDGFCSAITQLVQCSKRPVILVTGSLTLPHLQKFLQCSHILRMQPLLPRMLGTWLDVMCLADSGMCWPGLGAKFLNFFKGDMRRTINCLQFYVGSQEQVLNVDTVSQTNSQNNDVKANTDEENSCMSWADRDTVDDKNINDACDTDSHHVWHSFFNEYMHLKHMKCSVKMFDVWLSVPKILKMNFETEIEENSNRSQVSLESISVVLDSISLCDYFRYGSSETESHLTSQPWYVAETHSVSELESLDQYDRKYDTTRELCHELLINSIATAQENMGLEHRYDLDFPAMSAKRQRDHIVMRHNNLTSFLSPQSSLDRRALALDYWSSCRAICRIERSKTDANSKRNNRFCHYLKSLSVLCKSDSFDSLANSLLPNGM